MYIVGYVILSYIASYVLLRQLSAMPAGDDREPTDIEYGYAFMFSPITMVIFVMVAIFFVFLQVGRILGKFIVRKTEK